MVLCVVVLLWALFEYGYINFGTAYVIFLPCFLSAAIFRIYAITPLMSPTSGAVVVLALFPASQVLTVASAMGYFMAGIVVGHLAELGVFGWACSRSQRLYEMRPL